VNQSRVRRSREIGSSGVLAYRKLAGEGKGSQAEGKNIAGRGKTMRRDREACSQVTGSRVAGSGNKSHISYCNAATSLFPDILDKLLINCKTNIKRCGCNVSTL
jgi:hypothetical protein